MMPTGKTLRQPWNLVRLGMREMVAPLRNRVFGVAGPLGCKPFNVNIEITNRCCLRCQMCNTWQKDPGDEPSVDEWMRALDVLKDWLGVFRLTLTGGEPFMKQGIWEFLDHCVELALPVIINTNGYPLTERNLPRLVSLPLAQVIFSMDGMSPKVHDTIRGVEGAYQRTWENISFLARHTRPFILATNTVITGDNILELGRMATDLAERGIERIQFQPVQRNMAAESRTGWPYDTPLWPASPDHVEEGIRSLLEAKAAGAPVAHSTDEILLFRDYFLQGPRWTRPGPCASDYTMFHCDVMGNARMCVPFGKSSGNVFTQHPRDIWNSAQAAARRKVIVACRRPCLLNCSRQYTLQAMAERVHHGAIWLRRWGQSR
jgi:MoaA/NifB/PqqE/SkfB family radical SAM enzyme